MRDVKQIQTRLERRIPATAQTKICNDSLQRQTGMQLLEQLITQSCSVALRLNSSQNVDLPQLLKNLDPCRLKTVITGEELNVHAAGTAHSDALNSTLKNKSQTKRMSACLLCHLRAGSISPSLILQICFWSNSLFHVVEITPSILSSWPSSALQAIYLQPFLSRPEFILAK